MGFFSINGINFKLSAISLVGAITSQHVKAENAAPAFLYSFPLIIDGYQLSVSNLIEKDLIEMRASLLTALAIDETRPSVEVIPTISNYEKVADAGPSQ